MITYKSFVCPAVIRESGIVEELHRSTVYAVGGNSGLNKCYRLYMEWNRDPFTHVYVAYFDDKPIGVSVICPHREPHVQLFVRTPHRCQGIGGALLKMAVDSGMKFGGYYTDAASNLFEKYEIPNLTEEITTWSLSA